MQVDALVDAAERCEVTTARGTFGDGPVGCQRRVRDAGTPSLDLAEVVKYLPYGLHRSVDLACDSEFWQRDILPWRRVNTSPCSEIPDTDEV
jgi:hypothetical protein